MPKQTAMQQALGTGGAYLNKTNNPVGAMTSGINPIADSKYGGGSPTTLSGKTPGVDEGWSRMFGTATPTQLLDQRTKNGGAMPSIMPPKPTLGPGTDAPGAIPNVPQAAQTPQTAGTTNAMVPGSLNGNPDNGFSQEQQAGGQSNNEKGTTSPMAQALTMQPELAQGGIKAATVATQPAEAAAPAEQHMAPASMVDDGSGTAPGGAGTGGVTRGWQGVNYTLNAGVKWPADFVNWPKAKKEKWIAANAKPTSQIQADAATAAKQGGINAKGLPTADPNGPAPVTLKPGMSVAEIGAAVGNDPRLMDIAANAIQLFERANQTPQEAGFTGTQAAWRARQNEDYQRLLAMKEILAPYGIYFPDNMPTGGVGTPYDGENPPGPPPTTPPTTPPTDGGGQPPADQTETPIVPGPPADKVGGVANEYEGTNLDLSNPQITFNKILNNYIKQGYSPEHSRAMAEADFSAQMYQAMQNNRQSAVNLMGGALESFQGSPLYTGAQSSALKMLNEGDPTPWDTIRNQYVSDQDKAANQIVQGLSTGAARRGLSTGAVQGIQSDLLGQQANTTNRGLGDLDIQKAASGRQYAVQGLQNALTAMGGTSGVALSQSNNLASMIAGQPGDYQNPYAGYSAAMMNIDAVKAQADAAEKAGEFSWGDAASLLGTLGGAFLGGPAGAAILGGATTAATK